MCMDPCFSLFSIIFGLDKVQVTPTSSMRQPWCSASRMEQLYLILYGRGWGLLLALYRTVLRYSKSRVMYNFINFNMKLLYTYATPKAVTKVHASIIILWTQSTGYIRQIWQGHLLRQLRHHLPKCSILSWVHTHASSSSPCKPPRSSHDGPCELSSTMNRRTSLTVTKPTRTPCCSTNTTRGLQGAIVREQ